MWWVLILFVGILFDFIQCESVVVLFLLQIFFFFLFLITHKIFEIEYFNIVLRKLLTTIVLFFIQLRLLLHLLLLVIWWFSFIDFSYSLKLFTNFLVVCCSWPSGFRSLLRSSAVRFIELFKYLPFLFFLVMSQEYFLKELLNQLHLEDITVLCVKLKHLLKYLYQDTITNGYNVDASLIQNDT